ncbi:MAG: DUF2250 domain-containing protein [Candidatus Odinarchaeota archaeon]
MHSDGTHHHSDLKGLDLRIVYYLHNAGPAFEKKLAARLNEDTERIRARIRVLQASGYLERVSGRIVDYRTSGRSKVVKHRNHTYYRPTRKARVLLRKLDPNPDVNLRPPYKQA